jgi:hypothetical protein
MLMSVRYVIEVKSICSCHDVYTQFQDNQDRLQTVTNLWFPEEGGEFLDQLNKERRWLSSGLQRCVEWHRTIIALMMEAVQTSETSVNSYQSARRYDPEDGHLHTHRLKDLKPY